MSILDKHLAFVNAQVAFQEKQAKKYESAPRRANLHQATAANFKNLFSDLQEGSKALDDPTRQPKPVTLAQQLNLAPSELDGLPEDLVKELNITEADRTEHTILALMEEAGGIISLDRLLVSLYKKTKEVHKRVTLTSRMYRMNQKGYAYPVPGKKGVYSVRQLTEAEVAKLFGETTPTPEAAAVAA
jgi:hypothetical protein